MFALIRRLGIDLVLDVGANAGQTGRAFRAAGYTGRIVSFEPQAAVFAQLQQAAAGDPRWECRHLALGADDTTLTMNLSGYSESSSLLPMEVRHEQVWPDSRTVGTEQVAVRRLDGLAGELGLAAHRVLLKLDVQGYEHVVLAGATDTLGRVAAVYAELLFTPLYAGQSRYHEVMATLEAAGLRFGGFYEADPDPDTGLPMFANGLFVRPPEAS